MAARAVLRARVIPADLFEARQRREAGRTLFVAVEQGADVAAGQPARLPQRGASLLGERIESSRLGQRLYRTRVQADAPMEVGERRERASRARRFDRLPVVEAHV